MKWFRHISSSNRDEKLSRLVDEFGLEGYGAYWFILELIAEQLDDKNKTELQFSNKKWRKLLGFSPKKFRKLVDFYRKIGVFEIEISDCGEQLTTINCPNLLKYRDEYAIKKERKKSKNPDDVRTKSPLYTETETETEYTYPDLKVVDEKPKSPNGDVRESGNHEKEKKVNQEKLSPNQQIPYDKIVSLFNTQLSEAGSPPVRKLTDKRRRAIKTCWNSDKDFQTLEWWEKYFNYVSKSAFLMGHGGPWRADFDFLTTVSKLVRVIEGTYHKEIGNA